MIQSQKRSVNVHSTGDFFATLSIDHLRLLLPHRQVHTLEPIADVELSEKQNGQIGWLEAAGLKSPIYSFSRNLAILDVIPDGRRIAVVMVADSGSIGVLCDDLKIMPRTRFISHPLPTCMNAVGTPVTGLAIHNDAVCCMSSANHLLKYLSEKAQAVRSEACP